ncbi:MAG: hypothetical protein LBS87_01185 [Puniceicoccales bacterium]|jgi:hypothetical protein|nr:hypothetical protein [Puniceicoccales bacterium]
MDDFLLIDTSTQIIQCGTVGLGGKITGIMRGSGDVVEILPNFVGKICKSGFDDKLGIVYCYGPGSTLGLRSVLMAINVWVRFCRKKLKLYRYSSLSMARHLAKNGVITCGGSGKFTAETLDGEVKFLNSLDGFENFYFLNTKRIIPINTHGMQFVNYDLEKFEGNIFEITHEVETSDLFEVEKQHFLKWSCERHRGNNI